MMMVMSAFLPIPSVIMGEAAFTVDDYLYLSSSPLPPGDGNGGTGGGGFIDGGENNVSTGGANITWDLPTIANGSMRNETAVVGEDILSLNRKLLLEKEMADYPISDPLSVAIPMTLIYALILFSGLLGNISTCIVIARNNYMHTATNYYLFSLAMSDLLLLLTGLPQEIYHLWVKHPYVLGGAFCVIRGLMAEVATNSSILCIVSFSLERFVAIIYPLKSHKLSQLSRVIRIICIIWLVAFCLALPQAAQFGVADQMSKHNDDWVLIKGAWCTIVRQIFPYAFQISICVFFVIPMTIITVLYVMIGLKLRRSRGGPHRNIQELTVEPRNSASNRHSQSHVIRMLVAVVVAFFICWAPFHVQRLMAIYGTSQGDETSELFVIIYKGVTHVSGILYFVSTCINPILYHIMSNKFRQAFKDTMGRFCGRPNARLHNRTYSAVSHSHRSSRMGLHHGSRREQESCVNCRHTPTMCSCRGNSHKYLRSYNLDQPCSETTSLSLMNSSPSEKDRVIALSALDKSQGPLCQETKSNESSALRAFLSRKTTNSRPKSTTMSKSGGRSSGSSSSSSGCGLIKSRRSNSRPPSDPLESTKTTYNTVVDAQGKTKTTTPLVMSSPPRFRTSLHKNTCRATSYTSVDSGRSNNTISNSSLQDMDDSEYTGEELANYLAELKNTSKK